MGATGRGLETLRLGMVHGRRRVNLGLWTDLHLVGYLWLIELNLAG